MKKYLIRALSLSSLMLISTASFACTLKLAYQEWPPFVILDPNGGDPTGLDIESAKLLAKEAGCELEMKEVPWKRSLENLKQGSIDIITGASWTEERAQYAHYSNAYRNETLAVFVQKDKVGTYKASSLENFLQIPDITFGIQRGAAYGSQFEALSIRPEFTKKLRKATDDEQNIKKLANGRIDSMLASLESTYLTLKDLGLEGKVADLKDMRYSNGEIFLLFSKKSVSPDTVETFNKALDNAKADGSHGTLIRTYSN